MTPLEIILTIIIVIASLIFVGWLYDIIHKTLLEKAELLWYMSTSHPVKQPLN